MYGLAGVLTGPLGREWLLRVLGGSRSTGTALLDLLAQRFHGANELGRERLEHGGSLGGLGLQGTRQLGEQHLAGLEVRELLDLIGGQRLTVKDTALDDESRVLLGEVTQSLRRLHRVTGDKATAVGPANRSSSSEIPASLAAIL